MFVYDHLLFVSEYEYLWTPKFNKRENVFKANMSTSGAPNEYAVIHGKYGLESISVQAAKLENLCQDGLASLLLRPAVMHGTEK
jgi:hypothetical protein